MADTRRSGLLLLIITNDYAHEMVELRVLGAVRKVKSKLTPRSFRKVL